MKKQLLSILKFLLLICPSFVFAKTIDGSLNLLNLKQVRVNKCCEKYEIFIGARCTHINETEYGVKLWAPKFYDPISDNPVRVDDYYIAIGVPDCGKTQQWPVYHYATSMDRLQLLSSGILRHTIDHNRGYEQTVAIAPLHGKDEIKRHYDYLPGQYCLDKRLDENGTLESQFAIICTPVIKSSWTDADFLIRRIINPLFHLIALICYLFIAIVYFVIPTLRDLVGNIITTISICFVLATCADVIRIFTELSNHYSFLVADTIVYTSILASFFWLNSMGYYIWKTFKSRNVFLRVTDGKKYCYYSFYVWCSTITLSLVAIFAHFMIDVEPYNQGTYQKSILHEGADNIGKLGITIFFTPIAIIIMLNIYFYCSTMNIINRMQTYGRIHHKLRHRLFTLLFIIMTTSWLFLMLSWFNYDAVYYTYVGVNSMQAPLIMYVCVFNQKQVTFLLRKTCCYQNCICKCCRPEPECSSSTYNNGDCWGDEMQAMNNGLY